MSVKKDVADIIIQTELKTAEAGVGADSLYKRYADEIKKENPKVSAELKEIYSRLQKGKKKYEVYKKYLGDDVIQLIRIADEKSMSSSDIFKEYAPVKTMAETQIRSIRRSLLFPVIIIVLATFGMGAVITKMKNIASMGIEVNPAVRLIMDNFYIINVIFLTVFIIGLFVYPHKMPVLKKLFSVLNAIITLSIVKIMYTMTIPSKDIMETLIKYHKYKPKKRYKKGGAGDLVELIKEMGFINPIEAADIKMEADYSDFNAGVQRVLSRKLEDAKDMRELGSEAVKNVTVMAMAVPVIMMMSVIIGVMMAVMDMVGKMG